MEEEYLWNSIHTDTRSIYDFGRGYMIVVDKTTNQAEKQHNGAKIDSGFDTTGMLLETFEQILLKFSKTCI